MRYFLDFEFIEDGRTIEPISLGIVSASGRELYLEFAFDESRLTPWLQENVVPHLERKLRFSVAEARELILNFADPSDSPEFWGYYSAYDWVCFARVFGTMMDLPRDYPMLCLDLQQWWLQLGSPNIKPEQPAEQHHALADATWNRDLYHALARYAGKS